MSSPGVYIKLADNLRPNVRDEERGIRASKQSELLEDWTCSNKIAKNMKFVLGTEEIVNVDNWNSDTGLFSTIQAAYNNHWVLKTRPEDWWTSICQTIASCIDEHAKNSSVRKFFVSHERKKRLTVRIGTSIQGIDNENFFQQMISQIAENINKPEYTKIMEADFSQASSVDRIVNSITLMYSFKEYFTYFGELCCGIPGVIMQGTERDWMSLIDKLEQVENLLKPIDSVLEMAEWFASCKKTLKNLLDTYLRNPDKDWWSKIMTIRSFGSGGQTQLGGWFVRDFMGLRHNADMKELPSGVSVLPLTLVAGEVKEQASLVAGVTGYTVMADQVTDGNTTFPAVQSAIGWGLLMKPNSLVV